MIRNRSTMQISIHYQGNSKYKKSLKQQLSAYSKRILSEPWEPILEIHLDSIHIHGEKQVQQELLYDGVFTYRTKQSLATANELYTVVILLISLTRQRLYENNPDPTMENLMIISIMPSKADNQNNNDYDLKWSLGNNLITG